MINKEAILGFECSWINNESKLKIWCSSCMVLSDYYCLPHPFHCAASFFSDPYFYQQWRRTLKWFFCETILLKVFALVTFAGINSFCFNKLVISKETLVPSFKYVLSFSSLTMTETNFTQKIKRLVFTNQTNIRNILAILGNFGNFFCISFTWYSS